MRRRGARASTEGADPNPLTWVPFTRLRDRVRAAIAVPVLVGIVVFAAAVAVAIGITMFHGHEVPGTAIDPVSSEGASAGSASDEESASGAVPGPVEVGKHTPGASGATGGDGLPAGSDTAKFTVHVVGEVTSPGVVTVEPGARVSDAIAAAGGETKVAALEALNLARAVVDGEQIVVPDAALAEAWASGGNASAGAGVGASTGPSGNGTAAGGATSAGGGSRSGLLSLNSATSEDLQTLPRIGPALAQHIVDYREANGGFASVDQLLDVPGIGEKTLDGFRDLVTP
ncbi:ComEA family DNA-binding protein [Leucobacter sp. USHLN153]|uniref:ComEA family DNA-binding protein n=1 Tax=Leucobacter sp. USHLN153 TaxID=3081268 RepID=UPI0030173153